MKKLLCVAVVMLILFISSFVNAEGQKEEQTQEVSTITGEFDPLRFEGERLRVLINKSGWSSEVIPFISEFEQQTGMKVEVEEYPEDMYRQKVTIEMTSKSTTMDVFMSMFIQEGLKFHNAGWYEPLQPYLDNSSLTFPDFDYEDILPGSIAMGSIQGELYGIPITTEMEIMYYRKDLLKEYGIAVPTTMDELEKAAAKLTLDNDGDGTTDVYGITYRGKRAATVGILTLFMHNFGANWLDENRNPAWDTPEAYEAIDMYGRLLHLYGPPGSVNNHWYECTSLFSQGKVALFPEFTGQYAWLMDPSRSKVSDSLGCALHPAGPAGNHPNLVGWVLSINHLSKNKEAAWYFIQWATGKASALRVQKAGVTTPRQSAWDWSKQNSSPDFVDACVESLRLGTGDVLPAVLCVSELRDIIGDAVVTSIEGGDVKAAISKSIAEAKRLQETGNW